MNDWINGTCDAPPSCHPRHSDGTAVDPNTLLNVFDLVPEVRVPEVILNSMRLDYGNEQHLGRTTKLPPEKGEIYPAFVSGVDETLNEVAGIKLPDVSVPVSTNTGWNPRHETIGNMGLLIGITGGLAGWTLPLPLTDKMAEESGDPRPSLESLYPTKQKYIDLVEKAAEKLVLERYILRGDVDKIIRLAEYRYDDLMGTS
jgi:hypothetical protein